MISTYYIFETDWSVLKSEKQMLLTEGYPDNLRTPQEYFEARPLPEPFRSMTYIFSVAKNMSRPFPDNWVAGVMFHVFSKRLVELLKDH